MNTCVGLFVLKLGDLMGILSDILEENREKGLTIADSADYNGVFYADIDKVKVSIKELACIGIDKKKVKKLLNKLQLQYKNLLTASRKAILTEKIVLRLNNNNNFQSEYFKNRLASFIDNVQNQIYDITELVIELEKRIQLNNDIKENSISNEKIKMMIAYTLSNSMIAFLQQNYGLENYEIRYIVSDLSILFRQLEVDNVNLKGKKLVRYYLLQKNIIHESNNVCRNCGEKMFDEFDYCINCYEVN